jgi:hypothetical protein
MKTLRQHPIILFGIAAIVVAGVAGLFWARPAQASQGWGFGMSTSPAVVPSCTSYNLIPVRVDVPPGKYAGYVTGRLSNVRAGTVRKPAFGVDTVYNAGTPTIGYLIFNPPEGTQDGDVFHVTLTLSSTPALTPIVGSFEFSYNCSTGEITYTPAPLASTEINNGYGDNLVILAPNKDGFGNPDMEVWCLNPQGYETTAAITLSKATLAGLPAFPATNALIDQNNSCLVHVAAYVLTTGEYQVTIGPDPAGVINQIIFTGLTPTNIHYLKYNVNQPAP